MVHRTIYMILISNSLRLPKSLADSLFTNTSRDKISVKSRESKAPLRCIYLYTYIINPVKHPSSYIPSNQTQIPLAHLRIIKCSIIEINNNIKKSSKLKTTYHNPPNSITASRYLKIQIDRYHNLISLTSKFQSCPFQVPNTLYIRNCILDNYYAIYKHPPILFLTQSQLLLVLLLFTPSQKNNHITINLIR